MFLSLLVPLDRSSFAEQALPVAISIARRAQASLDLAEVHALYALNAHEGCLLPFDVCRDDDCKQQEQLYLDATARWVSAAAPVSVTAGVLAGSTVTPETIADSILERARSTRADLIVMSTHGRARCGLGSVADELIRRAPMPVLLVRPGPKPRMGPEPALDAILIPLDGSALAERVLEPVLDLARLMEARCTLLRVIASAASPEREQANEYLNGVALKLRMHGLEVRTQVVVARHTAEAILDEAAAQKINLIALATHGRSGFKRLLLGSIADRLVRAATSPVLVYHPNGTER